MNLLNNIGVYPKFSSNKYRYNGVYVPRVTEILSSMLHEEGLMGWSNYLGFKRQNYDKVLERSANIGTIVHNHIESYLRNGILIPEIPRDLYIECINAIDSFMSWYDIINNNSIKILGIEDQLVCNSFGGTIDLLININGKIYLVDFKTSNRITYKHFLQLSAYRYMYSLNNIEVDGLIILQLSKTDVSFNEYVLNMDNIEHQRYIDNCFSLFEGLVYSYYHRINIENNFNKVFSNISCR